MPGKPAPKAFEVSAAPVSPLFQTPVTMMTSPDCAAFFDWPAAWAMPAVPRPASLEKMPRATP